MRWAHGRISLTATAFPATVEDEIVDVFNATTFTASTANAGGKIRRKGVELEAGYRPSDAMRFGFSYHFLDAEQRRVAGAAGVREIRRPRHSAGLFAAGESGRLRWGATAAYVGERRDDDFSTFPSQVVTLGDYLLASFNLAYRVAPAIEAYVRAENAFDADYQDVFAYNTQGRTVHAGLRFRLGD